MRSSPYRERPYDNSSTSPMAAILTNRNHTRLVGLVEASESDQHRAGAGLRGDLSDSFDLVGRKIVTLHDKPQPVVPKRRAPVQRRNLVEVIDRLRNPTGRGPVFVSLTPQFLVRRQKADRPVVAASQGGPLLGKRLGASALRTFDAAAVAGRAAGGAAVGGQVAIFAFRHPDGNDLFAGGQFAHVGDESPGQVVALELRAGRCHAVVDPPAALQIAATTRGGSALQIVEQESVI